MKTVYFISGLGAQCKVFDRLVLPGGYQKHYLEFFSPEPGDNLRSYALRLGKDIDPGSTLIGLSLGGMMSAEIAKVRPDLNVILISSIPVKKEFPFMASALLRAGAHKILNDTMLSSVFPFLSSKLSTRSWDGDTASLIISMMRESDADLCKWFMEAIKLWDNDIYPDRIIRIHGTADHVLPIHDRNKIDYIIKKGSHLMVLDRYEEISLILKQILPAHRQA